MEPGLKRPLMDGVLGGHSIVKHGERETVSGLDEGPQDLLESLAVALPGPAQDAYVIHAAHQMHQCRGKVRSQLVRLAPTAIEGCQARPRVIFPYFTTRPVPLPLNSRAWFETDVP